jgi:hypothetical protein
MARENDLAATTWGGSASASPPREHALGDLHDNVRPEVADTADLPRRRGLIDRIVGEAGSPACW